MFIGQIISVLGSSMVQFALVWYLTKQTGSATILATATTVAILPGIILGPFVGALVDRWNRKRVMIWSDLIVALATAVLAVLFALNLTEIWHIMAILFIRSLAGTFQDPAKTASISLMVPKDQLTRLGGINQVVGGLLTTFSPALGALLIELLPIQGVLAVDLLTAAIAILMMIFLVKVPQPKSINISAKVSPKSLFADVKYGFKYMASWRGLLNIVLIACSLNLVLAPAGNLMPLLITNFFKKGAQELAWFEAAMGIGVILGGLLLGIWGGFKRKILNILVGIVGMSASILVIGLVSPNAYFSAVILMAVCGLMNAFTNGSLGPLLQTKVPSEMQGRVFTVLGSLAQALTPVGLFISGPIADRFGVQTAYLVGGVLGLIIAVFGFMTKSLMTFEKQLPGGELISDELKA
jgi:DHA3 family macrolide efflux protein-like MFS transporter